MSHEQLLSRNHIEFSELVMTFQDLNSVYDNQFTLYLDFQGWELFDLRIGKVIFRHKFQHFRQFTKDMLRLANDLTNLGMANISCNRGRRPKNSEIWSIKFLLRFYDIHDEYLFNDNLRNYLYYGFRKKEKDLADCY